MLKKNVQEFIRIQLEGLNDFKYEIEDDSEFIYVIFSLIQGNSCEKELMFKNIDDKSYYHSIFYGWKNVSLINNNKFFWIDLLSPNNNY